MSTAELISLQLRLEFERAMRNREDSLALRLIERLKRQNSAQAHCLAVDGTPASGSSVGSTNLAARCPVISVHPLHGTLSPIVDAEIAENVGDHCPNGPASWAKAAT